MVLVVPKGLLRMFSFLSSRHFFYFLQGNYSQLAKKGKERKKEKVKKGFGKMFPMICRAYDDEGYSSR